MSTKNCFVTGAAGFVGFSVIKKLLQEGFEVLGVDNLNDYYDVQLKKDRIEDLNLHAKENGYKFKFYKEDLLNKDKIEKIIVNEKVSIICHLAAQAGVRYSLDNPQSYIDNNITATLNLLEICRHQKIKDFIFSSTSSVYGLSEEMPFTEATNIDTPISVYSSSKRACELLCHTYHNLFGINFRILRFFTVYGPWGRPDMALFLFTKRIIEGKPIDVFNEDNMSRDFTYIEDIVQGIVASIKSEYEFEIINLGSGNPVPLNIFIKTIEEKLGQKSIRNHLPMQRGDVKDTFADISKARKLLNFSPKFNLETGISHFVDWYKDYYKIL